MSSPALFLAHGSPMLALEGGAWGRSVAAAGRDLGPLRAILVVSAHWETPGAFALTAGPRPGVMHDFGGFPEALYALDYLAPGSPDLAAEAAGLLRTAGLPADLDPDRPLDHGAWVPLRHLAPEARIPVVQLSLPRPRTPGLLLAAGRALSPLRQAGVVILGSGGVVHNLRRLDWPEGTGPQPWARDFQAWVDGRLQIRDLAALEGWPQAPGALESVPTSEHLDPLFVALGATGAAPSALFEGWQLGSLSLSSYRFE